MFRVLGGPKIQLLFCCFLCVFEGGGIENGLLRLPGTTLPARGQTLAWFGFLVIGWLALAVNIADWRTTGKFSRSVRGSFCPREVVRCCFFSLSVTACACARHARFFSDLIFFVVCNLRRAASVWNLRKREAWKRATSSRCAVVRAGRVIKLMPCCAT